MKTEKTKFPMIWEKKVLNSSRYQENFASCLQMWHNFWKIHRNGKENLCQIKT